MTHNIKPELTPIASDIIVATALNGVVYTENGRVHIKTNNQHLIYKYNGSRVGWYMRNIKTNDDFYLGEGASPTVELENLDIKDADAWAAIERPETPTDDVDGDVDDDAEV